jgi:hypothetical protein
MPVEYVKPDRRRGFKTPVARLQHGVENLSQTLSDTFNRLRMPGSARRSSASEADSDGEQDEEAEDEEEEGDEEEDAEEGELELSTGRRDSWSSADGSSVEYDHRADSTSRTRTISDSWGE